MFIRLKYGRANLFPVVFVDLIAFHSGSRNREAVARWAAAAAAADAAHQPPSMNSKYKNISTAHRLLLLTTSLKQDLHSDRWKSFIIILRVIMDYFIYNYYCAIPIHIV